LAQIDDNNDAETKDDLRHDNLENAIRLANMALLNISAAHDDLPEQP
jgi:hypothetical protein